LRFEAPTLEKTNTDFSVPVVSDLTPLEQETLCAASSISVLTDQWLQEGDQMFESSEQKISIYRDIRSMARNIPRYTNAVDVRDNNAVANRQSGKLDHAFGQLHSLWGKDPHIQSFLEEEKVYFEDKYKEWYGTLTEPGERDKFLKQLRQDQKCLGSEYSERETEALEMKARRAYFLPTITTASASEPV
jgi:hypothetical protein